jgi:cell pole-organizing protein PopZ
VCLLTGNLNLVGLMKAALALCILTLFTARAADAQQSRAQVTASVTVVEALGVTAGATAITQASGGALDVTTPLSIRGNVPRVVQVVDGQQARPISAQVRTGCAASVSIEKPACDVQTRISASTPAGRTILTYMVATVN